MAVSLATSPDRAGLGRLAIDRLFMTYVGVTGLISLAGGPLGWAIAAAHGAVIAVMALLVPRWPLPRNAVLKVVRLSYPVLLTPLLYTELGTLVQFIVEGTFDEMVMGWEIAVFGEHISMVMSEWWPWFTLSELIHLGYATYYVIFPIAFVGVLMTRGDAALERTVFAAAIAFYASYTFFIFFPVAGPRYFFEKIGPPRFYWRSAPCTAALTMESMPWSARGLCSSSSMLLVRRCFGSWAAVTGWSRPRNDGEPPKRRSQRCEPPVGSGRYGRQPIR